MCKAALFLGGRSGAARPLNPPTLVAVERVRTSSKHVGKFVIRASAANLNMDLALALHGAPIRECIRHLLLR